MKKIPTNNILAISIGVIIFTISLMVVISIRQSQRVSNTIQKMTHTSEMLLQVQKVIATLENETGIRSYAITGQPQFLQPVRSTGESLNSSMHRLQQIVTDPRQLQWLDSIKYYIGKRILFSDSLERIRKVSGAEAALQLVESGNSRRYTENVRRIGTEMEHLENVLLEKSKLKNYNIIIELNVLLYAMLGGVFLLGIFIIRRIKKDIDQRKLNEGKFSALLNAAPDATVMVDENGIIQMVNMQMEHLFGYAAGEITGKPVEMLMPATVRSVHVQHRKGFLKEAGVRAMGEGIELKALKKNGESFPVEISLSPIRTEEGLLVSASIRDITPRKKVEEEIRELNLELEERVKTRTADLEKILRKIEDYKYALDESSIIAITNQKGIITYVNDNFCNISRYSREELIGQDHRIINSGYHTKDFICNLWRTIAAGRIWKGELRNRAKDGTIYWVDTTIVPFLNDEGKPYQYIAIRADITRRKESEENLVKSEKIYKTIASSIPGSVICLIDHDYRYLLIEGDMIEKMGYSKQELLGHKAPDVLPASMFEAVLPELEKTFHGELVTRETSVNGYDVISRYIPLKDESDNVYAIMTVAIDVTELKQAQRNITELNRGLEEKVKIRTEQLKKSNEELEAFSYSVSHDLRAPLRGIIGFAGILEEEYGKQLDDEARRVISVIRENALKMGDLIDALLAFSRTGKQGLMKVMLNMDQLVNEVVHDLVQQDKSHSSIEWNIHDLLPARADVSTMRQVWINLVANAMKYSGNRAHPVIEIASCHNEKELVYFVKDNGAGFDEAYKDKLFKVFQRLHNIDEFEGTGIGLALVEKIISRHGGRVWAEGEEGKGACFYFSLP